MVKNCLGILFDWNEGDVSRFCLFLLRNLWHLHAKLLFVFTRGPERKALSNGITLV